MYLSSVTQKGQITIPAPLRQALMLHPGDQVQFTMKGHSITLIKHSRPVEELFGLYAVKHKVTDKAIENAITKGATRGNHA